MSETERRCGTCRWWEQIPDDPQWGYCEWFKENHTPQFCDPADYYPGMTRALFGTDCPTWEAKPNGNR